MGGLFGGGDTAEKYNRQQQAMTARATNQALRQFKKSKHDDILAAEYARLQDGGGFRPTSYSGPGHNINIDSGGNINMGRTAEAQGFMDKLIAGLGADENAFGDLLSQIKPGFGRLSMERGKESDNARTGAISNLRDQLAKRRVLGSSFANHEIGSLERQYMQDKDKILAESLVQELEMTNKVITDRTNARNQTIATALNEIQFETNVGAQLLQTTTSNMHDIQMAMTDIAKLRGTLALQEATARAGVVSNLAMPGLTSQADFANLESQEAAGPGQLIGQLVGTLGGAFLGGPAGAALGGSLFGGGGGATSSYGQGLPWHTSPLK